MKFWYKKYGRDIYGRNILRPVIPIEITYKDHSVQYEVLVDSGADFCFFDAQIGEILGINITSGKQDRVGGITVVVEDYYIHPLTIKVGGHSYEIEAGFLPNIARVGYGVVGQKGFFNNFVVKFDLLKEEIELEQRR